MSSGSTGSSGTSADGGDASSASSSGGSGGGPYGALPSGYCCTADKDCRKRRCVDDGTGQKMCMDDCRSQGACQYADFDFTCDAPNTFTDGLCRPPGGFTCRPASSFELGTKPIGACCTATGDGEAGLECQGGLCIAIGTGPFVCTNACDKPTDCKGAHVCQQITSTRKECIPANMTYTCQ